MSSEHIKGEIDLGGKDLAGSMQIFEIREQVMDALRDAGFRCADAGGGIGESHIWFRDESDEWFIALKHSKRVVKSN